MTKRKQIKRKQTATFKKWVAMFTNEFRRTLESISGYDYDDLTIKKILQGWHLKAKNLLEEFREGTGPRKYAREYIRGAMAHDRWVERVCVRGEPPDDDDDDY